jgi:hypothetical protein
MIWRLSSPLKHRRTGNHNQRSSEAQKNAWFIPEHVKSDVQQAKVVNRCFPALRCTLNSIIFTQISVRWQMRANALQQMPPAKCHRHPVLRRELGAAPRVSVRPDQCSFRASTDARQIRQCAEAAAKEEERHRMTSNGAN